MLPKQPQSVDDELGLEKHCFPVCLFRPSHKTQMHRISRIARIKNSGDIVEVYRHEKKNILHFLTAPDNSQGYFEKIRPPSTFAAIAEKRGAFRIVHAERFSAFDAGHFHREIRTFLIFTGTIRSENTLCRVAMVITPPMNSSRVHYSWDYRSQ